MALYNNNTTVDTSVDPELRGIPQTGTAIDTTQPVSQKVYIDKTYVDNNTEIINDPGGNRYEVQFNYGSSFKGDSGFTYDPVTKLVTIRGNINLGGYVKGKIVTNFNNFKLSGGTNGQVLATDGLGNLSWVDQTGGSGGGNGNSWSSWAVTGQNTLTADGEQTIQIIAGTNMSIITNTSNNSIRFDAVYSNTNVENFISTYGGHLTGGNLVITGTGHFYNINAAGNANIETLNVNAQSRLGSVGNVKITGGTNGQVLATDGTGNLHWTTPQAGPQGPTGAAGTAATITLGNVTTGNAGSNVLITNTGNSSAAVFNFTIPKGDHGDQGPEGPQGPKGDTGAQGVSVTLVGSVPTPADLPTPGGAGEGYIVTQTGNLWFWNSIASEWDDIGPIVGPQGDTGPQGATGPGVAPGGVTGQILVKSSDDDYDTAWQDLSDTTIHIGDTPPNSVVDGTVWWSSEEGRSYIQYNDQWVDMSPQTVMNPEAQLNSITFSDGTVQNTAFTNSSYSTDRLVNGNNQVVLNDDGTLSVPNLIHLNYNNSEVGFISTISNGVSLSGAFNNSVAITTDGNSGTKSWIFNPAGNIVFPDGSVQNTAYTGPEPANNAIIVSDTAPNANVEGKQWFNSVDGRTYVAYDNQWVDASPQTIDARAIRTDEDNNVEFPNDAIFVDGRVIQDASEGISSIRWVNMSNTEQNLEMLRAYSTPRGNNQSSTERGQLGLVYQSENVSGLYITSFNDEDEKTWTFEGTGNLRFPDDTIQTTAFQPATLLDGGGANSTYIGNYAPGSIPNPFDQELNTNDIVQFANVTAGYFIGDGSQLTGIPTSNADTGAVTFSNQVVIGTGDIYGGGGLYLAQGPASVANLQYFRIRGGDNPTHIHFDTGNNEYYDQYFGDDGKYVKLEAGSSGAVVLGTNNNAWTFEIDGNLTLPTNTSAINYANGSPLTAALPNVTTDNFRINGEDKGLIVDAADLKRFGFMKYSGIEGSLAHSAYTGAAVPFRIGRTSTADVTAANVNTFTTEIYVGTNGHVRIADDSVNDINDPTERLEVVGNIKANNIGNIAAINLDSSSSNVLYGNGVFAPATGGSNYSNSNVATFLESYGSNTISTTGNITSGNLIASANVLSNGYGKFSGTFDESIGANTGVVLGYAGGTPRVLFGTGNTLQTFEIDNDGGNLRFYQPGSTKATLTSSGNFTVSGTISATNIGNISAINLDDSSSNVLYGNGVFAPAAGGSSYSNSNVSTFLSSFGSNTITTTGNVTAGNLAFGSNSGQLNFATGAFISGNANSLTRDGSILLQPYTGAGSTFPGVIIGGAGRLIAPNGGVFQIFNSSDVTFQVAIKSTLSTAATSTTTGALIIPGGAGLAGSITTGVGALLTGPTFTPLVNTVAGFNSNVNSYTQVTFQNKSTGADATADIVLTADNGNDTTNYGDFGIINSGYDNNTPTNSLGNIVFAADTYLYAQGNVSNASQSGGNLAIGTTVPGKNVKIFAGGANSNSIIANISNTGVNVTGNLNATGTITANNFSGNITGTSPNVTLIAGSYSYIFDNGGTLTLPTGITGNEGGEIAFTQAANSTLAGNTVILDQYVDRIRFFEGGGNARGVYIDLTQAADGVNTLLNNRVSGLVNAGTFVTMDLIKATVTTSGNRGLSLAATTGSFTINISGTYGSSGGSSGTCGTATITTTPSGSQFNWNFVSQADGSTYIITDTTNNRAYRITLQIGGSYLNNMISIERLL